ncbi:kicstor complex protein c12orf66 [Anaeramoeba flamelloides]|uniref:Kicstor complex protein c12orf66 n=1 Tax=Anaeramoeba flamelloides TaxID=1746091 RepID=A0AAV7ZDD7_9EUKA|nr:kicstor complex protein c12orf66 [Anaeramoeba flamelloides]
MELTKTLTIFQKFLPKQKSESFQELYHKLSTEYEGLSKTISPLQLIQIFSSLSLFNFTEAQRATKEEIKLQQKRLERNQKKRDETHEKDESHELVLIMYKLGKFLKTFCVVEKEYYQGRINNQLNKKKKKKRKRSLSASLKNNEKLTLDLKYLKLKQKSTKLVEKIKSILSKSLRDQKNRRKTEKKKHDLDKMNQTKQFLEKKNMQSENPFQFNQKKPSSNHKANEKQNHDSLKEKDLKKKKNKQKKKTKSNKKQTNNNKQKQKQKHKHTHKHSHSHGHSHRHTQRDQVNKKVNDNKTKNRNKNKRKNNNNNNDDNDNDNNNNNNNTKKKNKKKNNNKNNGERQNRQIKEQNREQNLYFLSDLLLDLEHLMDIRLEMLSFYKKLAKLSELIVWNVDYKAILNKLTSTCYKFFGKIKHTLILKMEENCIFEIGIMINLFAVQYLFNKFDLLTTLLAMFNTKELIIKWKSKLNEPTKSFKLDPRIKGLHASNEDNNNKSHKNKNKNKKNNNYNYNFYLNYENNKNNNNNSDSDTDSDTDTDTDYDSDSDSDFNLDSNYSQNSRKKKRKKKIEKKMKKKRKKKKKKKKIRNIITKKKNRKRISSQIKKTAIQTDENENYTLVDWCSEFYESLVNKISIYYITGLRKSYNNSNFDRDSWMKQQKDRTDIFLNFNTFFTRNGAYWIALILNDVDENNINTNKLRNGYNCHKQKEIKNRNSLYRKVYKNHTLSETDESISGREIQEGSSVENDDFDGDNDDMEYEYDYDYGKSIGFGNGTEIERHQNKNYKYNYNYNDNDNEGEGEGEGEGENEDEDENLSKSKIKILFEDDLKNSKKINRERSFRSKITQKHFCIFSFPTESRYSNKDYPIMVNLLNESITKLRKYDKPIYHYDKKRSMTLWFAQVELNITLIVEFKKKKKNKDKNTLNFISKTIQQLRNINLYKRFVNND